MSINESHVCVVQVNYRTPEYLVRGLHALQAQRSDFPNLTVYIIDNDSNDHSVDYINAALLENGWNDWVEFHQAPQNGGYAYGNNLAINLIEASYPEAEYIWILNPDTLVRQGAIAPMLQTLELNPDLIVGSRLEDHDATVQKSSFKFPSIVTELSMALRLGVFDSLFKTFLQVNIDESPDWLSGASLMFRKATYDAIGGMDSGYFLYFEEVDFLYRAKGLGYQCAYVPDSKVIHEVGAATGISEYRYQQPRRPQYWFESRRRYFERNHSKFYLFLIDFICIPAYATWLFRKWLQRSPELQLEPPYFMRDFIRYSICNPFTWSVSRD